MKEKNEMRREIMRLLETAERDALEFVLEFLRQAERRTARGS